MTELRRGAPRFARKAHGPAAGARRVDAARIATHFRHTPPHTRNARRASVRAMSSDPRHRLGRLGERLAAEHLERLGYEIVARNHRTRHGEIDLVAADRDTLVIVEVKTRRGRGSPWDALGDPKRAQVRRMARAYLNEVSDRPRRRSIRFDAIGITFDATGRLTSLDHLEGAF